MDNDKNESDEGTTPTQMSATNNIPRNKRYRSSTGDELDSSLTQDNLTENSETKLTKNQIKQRKKKQKKQEQEQKMNESLDQTETENTTKQTTPKTPKIEQNTNILKITFTSINKYNLKKLNNITIVHCRFAK